MIHTLSNRAIYREKPKGSLRPIFSASCLQSSLAVVDESARRVLVLPSMKVMGSIRGFLDLVAWGRVRGRGRERGKERGRGRERGRERERRRGRGRGRRVGQTCFTVQLILHNNTQAT